MNCRHCNKKLEHIFLDLGFTPPSNAYLSASDLNKPEKYYPLRLFVCDKCWLVQTEDYAEADELFSPDYAYFSGTSSSWNEHSLRYADMITECLSLKKESFVVELASNDGYLLKNFLKAGIPCLGIEPTDSTAAVAEAQGIPVLREFFGLKTGERLAAEGKKADLIIGNNVYAHVPDINDFTAGMKALLKENGTITLEFTHLMRLIDNVLFDTVYHEHFSYLSLYTVNRIFSKSGLRVLDVEELPTQGGSLRVYGCHDKDSRKTSENVFALLQKEEAGRLQDLKLYLEFQQKVNFLKDNLLCFLVEQKRNGRKIAAYGAAAKGNTLLNYAGVKPDLLPFVCDAAAAKQGKYLPGSHVPILSPAVLKEYKPDMLLIFPWNIAKEVAAQNDYIQEWGGQFVVAVPEIKIWS